MLEMMERWLPAEDSGPLELEESWKSLVASADSLPRQKAAQQEALWELVTTEKEHIEKLGLMGEVQERLTALHSADLLKEVNPSLLLRNIGELERANRSFWATAIAPMLAHSRLSRGPLKPSLLEPGFEAMPAWAAPYTDFCLQHLGMDFYIMKNQKASELFREWMGWIEGQESMRRLQLKDLLAAPMQRLTKYPLLLKAVLKNTGEEEERRALGLMIQRASETANRLNVEFSNKHNLEMLRSISATIDSYDAVETANEELERLVRRLGVKVDLAQPMPFCGPRTMRRVWQKGEMKLRDGVGKTDVLCLLFTDMLLVCKAEKAKRGGLGQQPRLRVIRPPYHIQNIRVSRLLEGREGGFSFVYLNEFGLPAAAFVFATGSQEEAGRWVEAFENASKEFRHARSMAEASSRVAQHQHQHPLPSGATLSPRSPIDDLAERRRRRLSVGNVLLEQGRAMALKAGSHNHVSADDPDLLAVDSAPTVVHRKSSSMDSTVVAAQHLLDLAASTAAIPTAGVAGVTGAKEAEERRSRSVSSERSPPSSIKEHRSRRQASPQPPSEPALPPPPLIHQPRSASPSGTLTPGHGSSETLVPANGTTPELARRASPVRPMRTHTEESEGEASSPLSPASPEDEEEAALEALEAEDGQVPDLAQHHHHSPRPPGPEKSRRFEKRYHTADGIEAFKPKNTTYPAGILKRFSWNITNAMGSAAQAGGAEKAAKKMGPKSAHGSSEWRKHSTMSSESFCSSSGVSSSSSQLAVNDLDPATPTPTPAAAANELMHPHVSTVCVNDVQSGQASTGDDAPIRVSLDAESTTPQAIQTPTTSVEETPQKLPNRDDLLKLIMEGQLETSDV